MSQVILEIAKRSGGILTFVLLFYRYVSKCAKHSDCILYEAQIKIDSVRIYIYIYK